MLATRYALMYPQQTRQLVMVNPIGLEDWKAKGVPWRSVDQWFERELKPAPPALNSMNRKPTTAAAGSRSMTAGSICWPG